LSRVTQREIRREPVDQQLVEALGAREVRQAVLAEVSQVEALVEQSARGLGDEDTATVTGAHHARCVMDVADVLALDLPRLARMEPHAHPDLGLVGPGCPASARWASAAAATASPAEAKTQRSRRRRCRP
jgi:hypothetical protein